MKNPPKLATGELKTIESGPLLSETTFTPECGGNSNSFRVIPAERMMALVKVRPGTCVVRTVLSGGASKSRVTSPAETNCGKTRRASSARTLA